LPRTSELADLPDVNHADSSESFHYLFMVEGEPSGIPSIHQQGYKEGPESEVTGTKSCQFSVLVRPGRLVLLRVRQSAA
jgi:hypothetical protein